MPDKKPTKTFVLDLVEKAEITASRGAYLLNMSIWDFYDLMNKERIPFPDVTPEEMKEDLKDLRTLFKSTIEKRESYDWCNSG